MLRNRRFRCDDGVALLTDGLELHTMKSLEKVTAFITRRNAHSYIELLLFRHPTAGIQIPAGTVEDLESPADAVLREIHEETGLRDVVLKAQIGTLEKELPTPQFAILRQTTVYSRPDTGSFDWASFRKGIYVKKQREIDFFTQVTYEEYDQVPDSSYVSYQITGWVPSEALTNRMRRYFYHVTVDDNTPDEWQQEADHHIFTLFWAPISDLPEIIAPQNEWFEFVKHKLVNLTAETRT